MDWENERYVRVYVRETVDDAVLSWEAGALWDKLMKHFDRAGVLDMGKHGWKGVSILVRMPAEVVLRVCEELLIDGRIEQRGHHLIAPNFLPAQEAKQSDKQRQAESRGRRRDEVRLQEIVTKRDIESQNVTKHPDSVTSGHTASHPVTLSLAVPSLAVPSLADSLGHRGSDDRSRFDFESVYNHYPKKVKKAKGLTACKTQIRTGEVFQKFERCVMAMEQGWQHHDLTYCPSFEAFVNGRRWEDAEPPLPNRGDGPIVKSTKPYIPGGGKLEIL